MVNHEELKCELVWREISNYVEGEVDPQLRAAMDEHFHSCKRCASVLAGTRNVIALYGDERMLEVPAGFSRRLENRIARDVREERGRWSTWSAWLVPVAALLLIAGGVRLAGSFAPHHPTLAPMAQSGKGIPPELAVVVATDTKVFHVAGCSFIHNYDKDKLRNMTAKEALHQGFTPCPRCLRKYLEIAGAVGGATDDDDDENAEAQLAGR